VKIGVMRRERPADIKYVIIRECTKEVYKHPAFHKISDDSGVDSEWARVKLLLAKTKVMCKGQFTVNQRYDFNPMPFQHFRWHKSTFFSLRAAVFKLMPLT